MKAGRFGSAYFIQCHSMIVSLFFTEERRSFECSATLSSGDGSLGIA
jgi:hypothetical protein